MHKRSSRFLPVMAMTGTALLAIPAGLAAAAGPRSAGKVHLYEADTALAGNLGTVILTGAITDHGRDHQGIAGGGTINRIALTKGSFEVDVGKLGRKLLFPINPRTCSSAGSATAPVTIVQGTGTGAYRGISGTFETTASVASIAPRRKNGKCNTTATRYPGVLLVKGSGTVANK